MSHRRSLLVSLSAGGGAAALALGLTVGAPSAFAVPVPTAQSSPSGDGLEDVLTEPSDVVEDVTDRLTSGGSGSTAPSAPGGGESSTGSGSDGSGSTSEDAPLAPVGSAVKDVLGQADEKTKDTALAPVVPGPAPGGVLKLRVNAAPLATACAEVTGTGTAVANLDVTVGGHDVGTPLIEALPGLLAPCPSGSDSGSGSGSGSGSEPGSGTGSGSEGADASVSELVGACVRVKAEPPMEASVLLLDHELVAELTEAGVPLEKLVVPCPRPGGDGDGSGPGNDGGSDGDGSDGGAGDGSGGGSTGGGSAGGSGTADGGGDDACEPTINAQTTASSFLPSSGPQALPWVLLALALVGRRRLTQLVGLAGLTRSGGATRATQS
ncbi:hypothetical protein [Intrasporangium sp. DVR]|uniref:hypothetical protein n=1 Tax=Intrasporangium sp. DVR TaxID=3127867 RepID=UPI00313A698A